MRSRLVSLKYRCDSANVEKLKTASRDACTIFLQNLREVIGHDIKHRIPLDGEAIVELFDKDVIEYLDRFKMLIVDSITKGDKIKKQEGVR